METISEKLHFSIHGDFVTSFVRDLVRSDEHVKAIDTLRTLEGLPIEDMYKILTGTEKLVGVDYLELEDDNDVEYIEELKYQFAGVVKGNNSAYYRPYAYVRSYGYKDYRFAIADKAHIDRAEYYKRNQTDIIKMLDITVSKDITMGVAVLFEKVEVPDFISLTFNIGRDFQKACDTFLERCVLEVIDAEECNNTEPILNNTIKRSKKKEEKIELAQRTLSSFRSGEAINRQYAWVLPSGDSYECDYMEHMELADLICNEVFGVDPSSTIYEGKECPSADRYLEKIGAIKLGSSLMTGPYLNYEYDSKKLFTQAQLNKVFDWCELQDIAFPAAMFEELE